MRFSGGAEEGEDSAAEHRQQLFSSSSVGYINEHEHYKLYD